MDEELRSQATAISDVSSNTGTGCSWRRSAFGQYAAGALRPSPSPAILSSMAKGSTSFFIRRTPSRSARRSVRVPEQLTPYVERYLDEIRPRLLGCSHHDGLWPSLKGRPLSPAQIYVIVRARVFMKFQIFMGLHDFRRAAATYVAMDAPEKIGLIPGVLQHASLDVSEHYNLAQSIEASCRLAGYLLKTRSRLRPLFKKNGD